MSGVNKAFDSDNDQQQKAQPETDAAAGLSTIEKENNARENNVAKIKVVVCQLCMRIIDLLFYRGCKLCHNCETPLRKGLFDWPVSGNGTVQIHL